MADGIQATQGSGTTFATDEISSTHYPRVKISWGVDGAAVDASATDPFPTVQTGALPAGTNNIGDVDVLSVVPGTGATNLGKAVGNAAGATDTGVPPLAVRDDSLSSLSDAEGDYVPLRVNSTGALHVTGGGGGTEYAIGDVAGATDAGKVGLLIRDDSLSTLSDAEGDYVAGRVNSVGRLWASATIDAALPAGANSIGSVTANAGTDLNTSLLALEAGGNLAAVAASCSVLDDWDETNRAAVNIIAGQVGVQGGSGTTNALTQRVVLATDVALPAGTNAIGKLAANSGVDIGDVDVTSLPALAAGSNTIGSVGLVPSTSGGLSMHSLISTGTSGDATNIKASAGQLYGWSFSNINAAPAYVKVYNSASAPTAGSGTPVLRLIIPGNTAGAGSQVNGAMGLAFGTGIGYTIVTGAADANSTGVASAEVLVNFYYK